MIQNGRTEGSGRETRRKASGQENGKYRERPHVATLPNAKTLVLAKHEKDSPLGELGALLPLNDDRRLDEPAGGGGNIALSRPPTALVPLPLAPLAPPTGVTGIILAGVPGPANGVPGISPPAPPPPSRSRAQSLSIDSLRNIRGRGAAPVHPSPPPLGFTGVCIGVAMLVLGRWARLRLSSSWWTLGVRLWARSRAWWTGKRVLRPMAWASNVPWGRSVSG